MVEAYGKFRWKKGCVASCREIFGYSHCYRSVGSLTTTTSTTTSTHDNESSSAVMAHDKRSKGAGHQVQDTVVPIFFRRGNARSSNSKTNSMVNSSSSLSSLGKHIAKTDEKMDHLVSSNGQPPLPTNNLVDNGNDDINNGGRGGSGSGKFGEDGVMICASMTERRVLIAHRDQLAIFDFSVQISSSSLSQPPNEALLLWTHKLEGCIIETASLSGDGCAIALVLRGEGIGVPYPFGVRTFVRDGEDGSGVSDETLMPLSSSKTVAEKFKLGKTNTASSDGSGPNSGGEGGAGKPPLYRAKQGNNTTKRGGILYKPAQFLVHSAPVTRLSFRGYGTRTSSANHNTTSWSEDMEGNDLLLTTCSSDCSVRIFSQNSWRQLMHWNSPPKSRADWVRGISAANLGDLDSSNPKSGGTNVSGSTFKKRSEEVVSTPPKPKGVDNTSQHSQSSQNSHIAQHKYASSENASLTSTVSAGINNSLLLTTHAQQLSPSWTIPSHSIPGTHAGAWIAELTFRNTFPALRLSRLSYLKTGGDDALPAHFESVAAILPPGSIAEEVRLSGHLQGLDSKTILVAFSR